VNALLRMLVALVSCGLLASLPGCAQEPIPLVAVQGVIVKFVDGLEVSAQGTRFEVQAGPRAKLDAPSIAAALAALDATLRSDGVREIRPLFDEASAEQAPDIRLYYEIRMAGSAEAERLVLGLSVNPLVAEARLHPLGEPVERPVATPPEA
jgi:hypothetical protein